MRQEQMKAELKLLIRMIITDQLEKWAESTEQSPAKENPYDNPNASDEDADILESLDHL